MGLSPPAKKWNSKVPLIQGPDFYETQALSHDPGASPLTVDSIFRTKLVL